MQVWNLREVDAPDGTRDPVVLHSDDEGRAVLIRLDPGQQLGEHQVKEHTFIFVVEGAVRVGGGAEAVEAGPGTLALFEPNERRIISSSDGARVLMLLSPWPGEGHYRGGDSPGRPAR